MQRRKREAGKEFRTLGGWLLERARVRGMRWVSPRLMAGSFLVPGLLSMITPADPAAPGVRNSSRLFSEAVLGSVWCNEGAQCPWIRGAGSPFSHPCFVFSAFRVFPLSLPHTKSF